MQKAIYSQQSTQLMGDFLEKIAPHFDSGQSGTAVLDSVRDTVESVRSAAKNDPGVTVPPVLDKFLGELKAGDDTAVLDAVTRGMRAYQREHGVLPTADLVEAAVQQGHVAFRGYTPSGAVLDSAAAATATSGAHEATSLQPNRAVVAILAGMAEAIPFAGYVPFDIGSNQSKIAILSHRAGSAFGDYAADDIMDGTNVGKVFTSSSRFARIPVTTVANLAAAVTKITDRNLANDPFYCNPAATGIPVLGKRTNFYVNGLLAGRDQGGANSAFAFTVTLVGNNYTLSGTVNTTNGAIAVTGLSADLPNGTEVVAESFIDFEKAPGLIPSVLVKAETFDIFANSWRAMTKISPDSQSQLKNELSLDGNSEALLAMRTQMAMERHYKALLMAWNIGASSAAGAYNFDWANRSLQMNRGQIWLDFGAYLATLDQQMAVDTMDHGITHLYGSAWFAANVMAAGPDVFEPSGIMVRPSVYRVGRLFKRYEVYYSPRVVSEQADLSAATILAIGRSQQVARNPILLGDAVPPSFIPLGTNSDLNTQSAVFGRDYTAVNPHNLSAAATKRITITNLN